jgi:hypothetical protein
MAGAKMRTAAIVLALATGLAVAGSPALAGPELEEARRAVEAARSDPVVRAMAAVELDNAEVALIWTERAVTREAPTSEVAHLAYVTQQRAALARARAAERRAERALEALRRER